MTNKLNATVALDKAIALNAHINNVLTLFEIDGNIGALSRETLRAIKAASDLFDSHDFPGAITVQLSSQMKLAVQQLSQAELLSGVTARDVFTDDPRTLAIMIDAEIDSMLAEREHISRCEYEPMEESERLKIWVAFYHKPNREIFYGPELLKWVRKTAADLWGRGYYPSRYFGEDI